MPYRSDPRREYHAAVPQFERYLSTISGPLLDRIDLHIKVPAVDYQELAAKTPGTGSAAINYRMLDRKSWTWVLRSAKGPSMTVKSESTTALPPLSGAPGSSNHPSS